MYSPVWASAVPCTTNLVESSRNRIQCCVIRPFGKAFASSIRQIAMGHGILDFRLAFTLACRHKRNAAHYSMSGQLDTSRSHTRASLCVCWVCVVSKAICIMQTVGQETFASLATSLSLSFSAAQLSCREREGREREGRERKGRERVQRARETRTHMSLNCGKFNVPPFWLMESLSAPQTTAACCVSAASSQRPPVALPSVPLPSGCHCRRLRHRLATFLSPSSLS